MVSIRYQSPKACSKCKETKDLSEFYVYKQTTKAGIVDVHGAWCKACQIAKHKEEDSKKKQGVARIRKHGITLHEYWQLIGQQGGCCAICREKLRLVGDRRGAVIDHDHACCPGAHGCAKCVRGVLCADCNKGLGNFKDNPRVLADAMMYLTLKPILK